ncbi:MAG TPA: hypothetical protein VF458_21985 [Ktedonobacteraceae bacterium]
MRQIGQIKQVQVQRASLKRGMKPHRYYDPADIQVVEYLLLASEGIVGVTAGGERILDIHNSTHPESKNLDGVNGISLGFTSHYQAMRAKFGPHLWDGIAGENILVETEEAIALETLGKRVAARDRETGALLYLERLEVAAPCVEFSHFALNKPEPVPAGMLRDALIFLNDGQRGFYATFTGQKLLTLRAGDGIFVGI